MIAAMGLAATPVLTRVLTAEEYGMFAIAIAVVAFSATVPTQWLTSATLRYAATLDRQRLAGLTRRGLWFSAIPVVALASLGSTWAFRDDKAIFTVTIFYALCEAVFIVQWMRTRATMQAWKFAVGGVVRNFVSLALIVLAAALGLRINLVIVLCLMTISSLVAILAIWPYTDGVARRTRSSKTELTKWFAYGWPLILNYALGLVLAYVDRFMILGFLGSAAVGRFAPTYDLMFSIITLTTALVGLTAVPQLFATKDRPSQDLKLRRLRTRVIGVSGSVGFLMVAFWPHISLVLIGGSVRVTDWFFVATLSLSFVIMAYRFQYVNIVLQLSENTKVQTFATAAAVATNIGANWVLIPKLGLNGAALATLVASVVAVGSVPAWNITTKNFRGNR